MKRGKCLAVFDFDGTICPGDSIVPYLSFCVHEHLAPPAQYIQAALGYVMQRFSPGNVILAKEKTLSFIRGRSQDSLTSCAHAFWKACLVPRLYRDAVQEMERLRAKGYEIWIVSASADCYMRVATTYLPADAVYATPCILDGNGCYTGKIGLNLRDEEKTRLIREQIACRGEDGLEVALAYGDSVHDIPMLRSAAQPCLVNPGQKLRSIMNHARILHWK